MASVIKKNYKNNPYVYDIVNALWRLFRDYDEAQKTLNKNPTDIRAVLTRDYCMEFIRFMSETMEMGVKETSDTIVRMMGEGNE